MSSPGLRKFHHCTTLYLLLLGALLSIAQIDKVRTTLLCVFIHSFIHCLHQDQKIETAEKYTVHNTETERHR